MSASQMCAALNNYTQPQSPDPQLSRRTKHTYVHLKAKHAISNIINFQQLEFPHMYDSVQTLLMLVDKIYRTCI